MRWTQQTLALRQEALRRMKAIEETVFNDEMTAGEKVDAVIELLEER